MSLRKPNPDNGSLVEENFVEGRAAIVRSVHRTTVPRGTKQLLEQTKARTPDSSPFWLLVASLQRFVAVHHVLPVSGSLPDMISDTERYVALATKFKQKANDDANEVHFLSF
ncbi:unnamed protein product [Gongylonema pulchrum]|uniref:Uncharacterized protein n=1 Tax=Gongylonema pulchrum TaxID=637853 RepID=A0A183DCK2_9BILA|nr:unnamed protein product [Gongylonema pulchrum]